jgi:hypothetical protein
LRIQVLSIDVPVLFEVLIAMTFLIKSNDWNLNAIRIFYLRTGRFIKAGYKPADEAHPKVLLFLLLATIFLTLACFLRTCMVPAKRTSRFVPVGDAHPVKSMLTKQSHLEIVFSSA